jgi:hypothetical protein
MRRACLLIGGVLNALCAVLHAAFPVVLRWPETLATLSSENRAVTYALAFHTALVIAAFAYMSFVHTKAIIETNLGRFICRLVTAFYLLRVTEEWTIFSSSLPEALGMTAFCALIAGLYWWPSMRPAVSRVKSI